MAIPVKKRFKILDADYVHEAESMLLYGELPEGPLRTQVPVSSLTKVDLSRLTTEEKILALKIFAEDLKGKTVDFVFDPDLDKRLKANDPLKY